MKKYLMAVLVAVSCFLSACGDSVAKPEVIETEETKKNVAAEVISTTENSAVETTTVENDSENTVNYFENIQFNATPVALNSEGCNFLESEPLALVKDKIYYYSSEQDTEDENQYNMNINSYNTTNGNSQTIKTFPGFIGYALNACYVNDWVLSVGQEHGKNAVCFATNVNDNSVFEVYNIPEDAGSESFRYLYAVNQTQFVEYRHTFNSDNYNKTIHLRLGSLAVTSGKPEVVFTDINTETIQASFNDNNLPASVIAADDKIFVLTSTDIAYSDITLSTYNLDGELLYTDNLDIIDEAMENVENREVFNFNVCGNTLFMNFKNTKQFVVKLVDGISEEIVFDNLKYCKTINSNDSNKFVLYENEYSEEPNLETGRLTQHYKVYLYDAENNTLSGLVEDDMAWLTASENKFVYCSTPSGECYSVII